MPVKLKDGIIIDFEEPIMFGDMYLWKTFMVSREKVRTWRFYPIIGGKPLITPKTRLQISKIKDKKYVEVPSDRLIVDVVFEEPLEVEDEDILFDDIIKNIEQDSLAAFRERVRHMAFFRAQSFAGLVLRGLQSNGQMKVEETHGRAWVAKSNALSHDDVNSNVDELSKIYGEHTYFCCIRMLKDESENVAFDFHFLPPSEEDLDHISESLYSIRQTPDMLHHEGREVWIDFLDRYRHK